MKHYFLSSLNVLLLFSLFSLGLTFSFAQSCIVAPYFEDFENGPGGWTVENESGPFIVVTPTWALGTPAKTIINTPGSGQNSWVTGGLGPTTYSSGEASAVQSPCIDLSALTDPYVTFKIWWSTDGPSDGAVLQYSLDNGGNWFTIGSLNSGINWYNEDNVVATPGGGNDGWSGSLNNNNGSNDWRQAQHHIPQLAGVTNVMFRFLFETDFGGQEDGIGFDAFAVGDLPTVNLGADQSICLGDTAFLDPGDFPNGLVLWNSGDTIDVLSTLTPGVFVATVYDSLGFSNTDTVAVDVSFTSVNLGPDLNLCPNTSVILDAGNPGANYVWSDNTVDQTLDVAGAGTYYVTVTDSVGCVRSDTVNVIVSPPPVIDLGNDTSICLGSSITIDAGAAPSGSTYDWSFGANTQVVTIAAPGQYFVEITTPLGCTSSDTVLLDVQLAPVIDLGTDRVECDQFTLTAGNPGATYLWSTSATTQSVTSSMPGTYWVQVTNSLGCSASDTVVISPGLAPQVDLGGNQVLCDGNTVTLDGSTSEPSDTYFWSTASTSPSIVASLPGFYYVVVTDTNNCVSSDTIQVFESNLSVDLGPDVRFCDGETIVLNAGSGGTSYDWSNNATTQSIQVTDGGMYSVSVTDALGCTVADDVEAIELPAFDADFDAPISVDVFDPVAFTDMSSASATSWFWDFGDNATSSSQNPTHTYLGVGTYTVTLIAANADCADTIQMQIVVNIFTGLEDELENSLQIYPNPTTDRFYVAYDLSKPVDMMLRLRDISGKEVYAREIQRSATASEEVNISHLAAGFYIVELQAGEIVMRKKVSVQ